MTYVDPVSLRDALIKYYSETELRGLCFALNIDYESLGGRGKAGNAQELVSYALRQKRYDELVDYVRRTRAHAQLPTTSAPPSIPEAVAPATSGGTTHIYQAPVVQGNVDNLVTDGGQMTQSEKKVRVKAETIIGNVGDGSFSNTGQIAGGDIILGGQPVPQTREEFSKQLQALQALLQEATSQNEFAKERDGKEAVEAVAKIEAELAEEEPRKLTITNRLNEIKEGLENATGVVQAAGKAGAAVIKAAPIVVALIKLAGILF